MYAYPFDNLSETPEKFIISTGPIPPGIWFECTDGRREWCCMVCEGRKREDSTRSRNLEGESPERGIAGGEGVQD